MNRNLFLKEMRRNTLSLLLWILVISLLISFTMSVFQTFVENRSKVMGMLNLVPKGALQFKGISNVNDLLSVLGFYAVNNVIYMMVLGSIFAMVLGSNILLKEEYNKTAEFLLTKPLDPQRGFFQQGGSHFSSCDSSECSHCPGWFHQYETGSKKSFQYERISDPFALHADAQSAFWCSRLIHVQPG